MNYLGVDIGGTNLKAGIVSENGEILRQNALRTPTNFADFSGALGALVGGLLADGIFIERAGIGCKGIIQPLTTEVQICPGEFSFLEKNRLVDLLDGALPPGVRVVGDNDARAALAGERVWGAARSVDDALMLTLGTGIGGAILAGGQIIRGKSGVAGHLGHLTIEPLGRLCFCGNRGCLETFFSARAIESAAVDAILRGCETSLTAEFHDDLKSLTCADVFEAAENGDPTAKLIVEDSIMVLGAGIAGLLLAFDPEILIIGGSIAEAGEALFKPLSREIRRRTKRWLPDQPPIMKPAHAKSSGIIGAAALAVAFQS
ncbi:MAG TPA: ROK family protein [Pyrinomonadaceae bacterium]|jgi:glucokinase